MYFDIKFCLSSIVKSSQASLPTFLSEPDPLICSIHIVSDQLCVGISTAAFVAMASELFHKAVTVFVCV